MQAIIDKNNQEAREALDVVVPADLPEDISQGIRKQGRVRRIVVDRQACIGAQSCTVITPELFKMDDANLAYVNDPNAHTDEELLLSAQACPVLAILLYDEKGNKIFPEM